MAISCLNAVLVYPVQLDGLLILLDSIKGKGRKPIYYWRTGNIHVSSRVGSSALNMQIAKHGQGQKPPFR